MYQVQINSPYNYLGPNFIDVEWEFIKGNVELPSVRKYLEMISVDKPENEKSILSLAVCLPMAHEAIAASLYMPACIYNKAQQIWVYQREASDIVFNLYYEESNSDNKDKRYEKLRPFGMQNADFTMEKDNYYRAQLCNYVYELMFKGNSKKIINQIIADIENASDKVKMKVAREYWKKLTIFNRWSNRYLANSFETKIRSVGEHITDYPLRYCDICNAFAEQEEILAECEHNRWNVQQLLMGFRAYTMREIDEYSKSVDKKTFKSDMKKGREKAHLNICSFAHLDDVDEGAKDYDRIFNHAIPEILKITEEAKINPKTVKKNKN